MIIIIIVLLLLDPTHRRHSVPEESFPRLIVCACKVEL